MKRFLLIDIGAGTMDVLYFDRDSELHYKAVVKSPAPLLAEEAAAAKGDLVITGVEMGGGAMAGILKDRAASGGVVISRSAAATLHHNPQIVRSWGLNVVADDEAEALVGKPGYTHLTFRDIDPGRLQRIVEGLGVRFAFDAVAVCAQDHGVPPAGVSHLDFRHRLFRAALDPAPFPHRLLYRAEEVPPSMNRLRAIATAALELPAANAYVMDSGMAAILGASMDTHARGRGAALVLDVATSHTVGAAMLGDELTGFFEYHTRDITASRLEYLLRELAQGSLTHERLLAEGGHGAYVRKAVGFEHVEVILATGPKRRLAEAVRFPLVMGAPLGDNMMTGTVGLLEALRRKEGLPEIRYS